jgi:RNA polymerase sigma factor (TIGR02999 family)
MAPGDSPSPDPAPSIDAGQVTQLLQAYESGDQSAFDRLVPLVYDELRRMARRQLRRGARGVTLDTTALVHEAYLKLAGSARLRLNDRGHLMAVTACAMRQVIVSRARARLAHKRGAGDVPLTLDEERVGRAPSAERLLELDRALQRLRERDQQLAKVFDCRYFGGFSEEETAEALGLSLRTAQRAWMRARAWLRSDLEGGLDTPGTS